MPVENAIDILKGLLPKFSPSMGNWKAVQQAIKELEDCNGIQIKINNEETRKWNTQMEANYKFHRRLLALEKGFMYKSDPDLMPREMRKEIYGHDGM